MPPMKKRNFFLCLPQLLLALALFIPSVPKSVNAAEAAWSAISMPQGGTVVDMAVSPNQNGLIYLLTFSGEHGLWRTNDDGNTWQRILQTGDSGLTSIERICLAADSTFYVAGNSGSGPTCLKSTDNGQSFIAFTLPAEVDSTAGFAAFDDRRFFFASFDGVWSRIWHTTNGSTFESTAVSAVPCSVLELSPDFTNDNTLIAGGGDGNIYLSTNGGTTFSGLQQSPLTGDISLAFAADFASSRYIYASSRTAGAGIWRLKIGEPVWSRIDTGLPAGMMISGLSITTEGIVYAPSANQVSASNGGLVRKTPYTTWEMVRDGLPAGATMWGLESRGNKLYSLDTATDRIMTYTDTLASAVELISPSTGAPGLGAFSSGGVGGIDLLWRNPGGASGYEWQVSDLADMSVPRSEGTTGAETYRLRNLEPGVTYYWRVRVTSPLAGPWSQVRSFTTALGAPVLLTPAPGSTPSTLLPPFQWQQATGATSYELMLSAEADFQTLAFWPMAINGNAWRPETALTPATAYFWKVKAIGRNSFSPWSAVSVFTTAAPPTTPPPAPTTTAPATMSSPPPTSAAAAPSTTPAPTTTATTAAAPVPIERLAASTPVPGWMVLMMLGLGGLFLVVLTLIVGAKKSRRS